jgi:subfamily B ATP-binding cassette protein MsbA
VPKQRSTFLRLIRECLHSPVRLAFAVAGFGVLGAGRLALTWLVKLWVEGPLATHDPSEVRRLIAEAAALTVGMFVALTSSRILLAAVNQDLLERLRVRAATRLFEVEVSTVRRLPVGEWVSRVFSDADALGGFVENVVKRLLGDGLVAVGAVAMMFWLDYRLAIAIAALVPVLALLLAAVGRSIRRWTSVARKEIGAATAAMTEQLHGLTTIKGFQSEGAEAARFGNMVAAFRRRAMGAEVWSSLLVGTVFLATGLGLLGVVAFGSREILAHRLTQGALLAFCLYAVQAIEPMRRLSDLHGMLQKALVSAQRVYEVTDLEPREAVGGRAIPRPVRGELHLERVGFRYRETEPILESVTLRVSRGEPIALVSASGGGKSTITRLLLRFETPRAGHIRLDGREITELRLADLRQAVCVVEQDAFLFAGTVSENLRYGSPAASESRVEAAAESAGLGPLLASFPGGLRARLAEGARDLSGGEKQRLALARAILRDPAVLVLDESLSALDSESEGGIFDRLGEWLSRRTVVVMTHRLSTVVRFPRVVLLERGRVAADGPPARLLTGDSGFSDLFAEQADLALPARRA